MPAGQVTCMFRRVIRFIACAITICCYAAGDENQYMYKIMYYLKAPANTCTHTG